MNIVAVSLFPEMFQAIREYGVVGKAIENNTVNLCCVNPRDYARGQYKKVDDRPYGGGPGMVMQAEPLAQAIEQAKQQASHGNKSVKCVYLSPQGRLFNQAIAQQAADRSQHESLVLIAGRYEGIDERVINAYVDEEWSMGDFVISGGELAAMTAIDAIARLLPDVLGHELSAEQDSFTNGLLDYPHYTRPEVFADQAVPKVLLSGNHAEIESWRLQQSLGRTWLRRPELLKERVLSDKEQSLLDSFIKEYQDK